MKVNLMKEKSPAQSGGNCAGLVMPASAGNLRFDIALDVRGVCQLQADFHSITESPLAVAREIADLLTPAIEAIASFRVATVESDHHETVADADRGAFFSEPGRKVRVDVIGGKRYFIVHIEDLSVWLYLPI